MVCFFFLSEPRSRHVLLQVGTRVLAALLSFIVSFSFSISLTGSSSLSLALHPSLFLSIYISICFLKVVFCQAAALVSELARAWRL